MPVRGGGAAFFKGAGATFSWGDRERAASEAAGMPVTRCVLQADVVDGPVLLFEKLTVVSKTNPAAMLRVRRPTFTASDIVSAIEAAEFKRRRWGRSWDAGDLRRIVLGDAVFENGKLIVSFVYR